MKLTLLLCLISVSAFAQQKEEPSKKDKPVKLSDYDSLDFNWKKKLYSIGGREHCYCPTPEQVQQMPGELSPYLYTKPLGKIYMDKNDTATFNLLNKNSFKIFTDSTKLKKKNPVIL